MDSGRWRRRARLDSAAPRRPSARLSCHLFHYAMFLVYQYALTIRASIIQPNHALKVIEKEQADE